MGGGGDLGGPSWEAVGALPLEEWELGAALGLQGITGRALHGAEGLVRCEGGGLRRATESRNSDRGRGGGWLGGTRLACERRHVGGQRLSWGPR